MYCSLYGKYNSLTSGAGEETRISVGVMDLTGGIYEYIYGGEKSRAQLKRLKRISINEIDVMRNRVLAYVALLLGNLKSSTEKTWH